MTMQLAGLDPEVRERAELCMEWARYFKIPVTITSTVRSWAAQTKLRNQYEACLARGENVNPNNPNPACRYPANQPGDSSHNFGLSWDSWVPAGKLSNGMTYQDAWDFLRRYAGFHVPENDRIHAEVPGWRAHATVTRRG